MNIEGQAKGGQAVVGWKVAIYSSSKEETKQFDGAVCKLTFPNCTLMAINAILGDASAIDQVEQMQQ